MIVILKQFLLIVLKNRFNVFFKITNIFDHNIEWLDFFEKNQFSETFIIYDLNYSNLNLLVDKFSIQLKIKIETVFYDNYDHNNIDHFIIKEIQNQYIFYTLIRNTYIKHVTKVNESIKKKGYALF